MRFVNHLLTRDNARLAKCCFLAVVGRSGSGRSSLVLAGMLPRLRLTGSELRLAVLKPSNEPLMQWERADEQFGANRLGHSDVEARVDVAEEDQPHKFLDRSRWAVVVNALEGSAVLQVLRPRIEHRAQQQLLSDPAVRLPLSQTAEIASERHTLAELLAQPETEPAPLES